MNACVINLISHNFALLEWRYVPWLLLQLLRAAARLVWRCRATAAAAGCVANVR